tara:strand:- start:120 stop:413 length:294 start_codon:yes stop_codon:yes gene_type:complete
MSEEVETSFTKLKSGDWGVRVKSDAAPKSGDNMQISKKDGSKSTVTIAEVIWHGEAEGIYLCSIVKREPKRRPGPEPKPQGEDPRWAPQEPMQEDPF